MIHAEKTCPACDATFIPAGYLTAIQAENATTCSPVCSSIHAHGRKRDAVLRGAEQTSCQCESCEQIRTEDRSARIAAYAASRGLTVATGPRPTQTPEERARIFARMFKNRRDYAERTDFVVQE